MGSTHYLDRSSIIKGELWGGEGVTQWDFGPENGNIVEITIKHAEVVDSLQFKYVTGNGTIEYSGKFGGERGQSMTIPIHWPEEYLTEIRGTTGTFNKAKVIGTLYFTTNRNKEYGPFGRTDNGEPFKFINEKKRAIVGFYGNKGNFINAIGVYHTDPPVPPIVIPKVISEITMDEDIPREVGPWGGNKGKAWDDGRLQGRIIEIDVHVGNGAIHALHYRYKREDHYDSVVLSNKHGGRGATTIYRIELDKENEKDKKKSSPEELVGISGFYGAIAIDGNCCVEYQVVRSISFYTKKGKYGPFGTEIGTFFNSPACDAKVVGFHGRSGEYLDAIGVHVEY